VLRRTGDDAGMITVHLFEQGWLWMIPLPEGIMSVGVVGDRPISSLGRTTSTEIFARALAASPSAVDRVTKAELIRGHCLPPRTIPLMRGGSRATATLSQAMPSPS
jgi:hypothetical protein